MTAAQYRSALCRLHLSQVGAARLFGANERTSRRWALGERDVPSAVTILLRLMLADKITAKEIDDARKS